MHSALGGCCSCRQAGRRRRNRVPVPLLVNNKRERERERDKENDGQNEAYRCLREEGVANRVLEEAWIASAVKTVVILFSAMPLRHFEACRP